MPQNGHTQTAWQTIIELPDAETAGIFADGLEELGDSSAFFESEDEQRWQVVLYHEHKPALTQIEERLTLLVASCGMTQTPTWSLAPVPEADWVKESQKLFSAIRIGRFFIYPSWHEGEIPDVKFPIHIDPERAFGTGSHETTSGCVAMLDKLEASIHPTSILDMGCGSGLLAIAAAKLWPKAKVLAVDIDPVSVETTEKNARINDVDLHIVAEQGDGYAAPIVATRSPYGLITANILAAPLIQMAHAAALVLDRNGFIVLAGLLDEQETDVRRAYEKQGLTIVDHIRKGRWPVLVMKK